LLCSSQSIPSNCYKKYNIEVEALMAYYGPMSANHGHPPALEIEDEPPFGDMKIRKIAPWSWKDAMLLYLWLWSLLFLFGS
jgi:hypothetical protein